MKKQFLAVTLLASLMTPCIQAEDAPPASGESQASDAPKKELQFVEESVGDVQLPGGGIEGLRVGSKIEFNEAWATEHSAPLRRPFEIIVPKHKPVFVAYHDKAEGRAELVNIQFATEDKKLVESVRLANINIPVEPPMEERLNILADLLMRDGVKMATANWPKSAPKQIYKTKIGKYDGVVVHGFMEDPERGSYFFKLAGILEEGQKEGLMAFAMIDPTLSEVKTPADLGSKGNALKVIHSIRFADDSGQSEESKAQ